MSLSSFFTKNEPTLTVAIMPALMLQTVLVINFFKSLMLIFYHRPQILSTLINFYKINPNTFIVYKYFFYNN